MISAILLLFQQKWRTSINRFAEAMTLFAVMQAAIFPVLHTGRPWFAIYWLFPYPSTNRIWPQFKSPLMWDVFAVSTYFITSLLFWYLGLIPDLAALRDSSTSRWMRRIYGPLSFGWRGSARHWHHYKIAYLLLAGLATPLVLSVHTIVSYDFAVSVVPARHHRHREVVAHDGVHRKHQRSRQAGEQQVGDLVMVPVPRGASPTKRKGSVDAAHPARGGAVAQRGQVGDEAQVPEEQRGDEVGGDGEYVPHQRALELRPDAVRARIREEPVDGEPGAPGVEHRKQRRLQHREERHRLGEPVDAGAPLLLEEEEDGRDQRPGVADADPPDEIDDAEGPGDRDVVAPHPDALGDRHHQREGEQARAGETQPDEEQPALAGLAPDVVEQRLVDGAVVLLAFEQW